MTVQKHTASSKVTMEQKNFKVPLMHICSLYAQNTGYIKYAV